MPRFLFWMMLLSVPAFAGEPCDRARHDLEQALQSLPRACRSNSDCEPLYLRADICASPVVARKNALGPAMERELLPLQANVRQACSAEWKQRPACSPVPADAECRKNMCMDGRQPKSKTETFDWSVYSFDHGTIRNSCAPWDGPALMLELRPVRSSTDVSPQLQLYIWRSLSDVMTSPSHTIALAQSREGAASRCQGQSRCEAADSGSVSFEHLTEDGASGDYELHFHDGTVLRGRFHATWNHERVMCG